jgi:hypothetical protein
LLGRRFFLVALLPFGVRHAVNLLAGIVEADFYVEVVGRGLVSLGQAVAAEAGQVHQVDVLRVGATTQVLDQTAKGGSFEFGAFLIVHWDVSA